MPALLSSPPPPSPAKRWPLQRFTATVTPLLLLYDLCPPSVVYGERPEIVNSTVVQDYTAVIFCAHLVAMRFSLLLVLGKYSYALSQQPS